MATYSVIAVQRSQAQLTTPTLTPLGPLMADVQWVDTLNEAPEASLSLSVDSVQDDIKQSLRDLAAQPLEIWIYRDSVLVFSGPLIGGELRDRVLTLTARGLEYYAAYMMVTTNKSFTTIDQYTIAKTFIDDWQALDYGNYGIDTSGIGTSGTTRSLEIPGVTEPREAYSILIDFAGLDNGFDWYVDPTTRDLILGDRGSDKSSTVFLELGVQSSSIRFAVSPGIVASEVFATGTGGTAITTSVSNATLRAAFGRAGMAVAIDSEPDTTTLDDAAQAVLDERAESYFVPGPAIVPVTGAGVSDFNVGDTVTYTYDAGLGQQTGAWRVRQRTVTVDSQGTEFISVEFV